MFPDTHKKSQKERLKELLSDGLPHDNHELNGICFAYGQRLNEMKRAGDLDFDNWCDKHSSAHWWWKIKKASEYVQTFFI